MKIGVQLYTVRKHAQKDLYSSLVELSKLGLLQIEAARIPFDKASADTFCRAQNELGTTVCATQIKFCKLLQNREEIIDFHKRTGCNTAVISVMVTESIMGGRDALTKFCKKASELAKIYKDNGIQLCYHNHDFEFIKIDKDTKYDIILQQMEGVKMVLDTYWATKAGYHLPSLIQKLKGRIEGLHLRDYLLTSKLIMCNPKDAAIGEGVIDFGKVIETAKTCDVRYAAIEQNAKMPYEELKKSVEHINQLGYGELF